MRLFSPALLLAGVALVALPAIAADQAGVSAAVHGQVALNRPQGVVGQQVVGGQPILLQDAIQSGARSGMQILLLDETVFTIGPESAVVIDEFVYDPSTSVGKVSAQVTKGVFRFVTGRVARKNPEDMNVQLPAGTIGVRGTMVAGRVDPVSQQSTIVLLGEGPNNNTGSQPSALIACNADVCKTVNRPGFATTIDGPGIAPSDPFPMPIEQLRALTQAVSDPEGWVETAENASPSDVAAGPNGAQDGDPRSAGDISGQHDVDGLQASDRTRRRLERIDALDMATTDASHFSNNTIATPFGPLEIPAGCASLQECLPGGPTPPTIPNFGDITTYDQLSTLAGSGLQQAVYFQRGLGLVDSDGNPDGSYTFQLQLFLDSEPSARLSISNINSTRLGLEEKSFSTVTPLSGFQSGQGVPAIFAAEGTITTDSGGRCDSGCEAAAIAQPYNARGRIADSVRQSMAIVAPTATGAPIVGTVTADPGAEIRRP
jgi:hypothetical protein